MKTTIVKGGNQPIKEIDWSKKQILQSNKTGTIVLSTGLHNESTFGAVYISSSTGYHSDDLIKDNFTPLTEPITITFEND